MKKDKTEVEKEKSQESIQFLEWQSKLRIQDEEEIFWNVQERRNELEILLKILKIALLSTTWDADRFDSFFAQLFFIIWSIIFYRLKIKAVLFSIPVKSFIEVLPEIIYLIDWH